MFLRTLYEGRMPRTLNPRSNPEIASHWQADTDTSREIAQAIEEAERGNENERSIEKGIPPLMLANMKENTSDTAADRWLGTCFEEFVHLRVEDLDHTPIQTQLSPTGLISIAAADIDQQPQECMSQANETRVNQPFFQRLRNGLIGRVFRPTHCESASVTRSEIENTEASSQLRFLSMLRRVNELSSQIEVPDDLGGLSYPQILRLPTFRYSIREADHSDAAHTCKESDLNTLCAICCYKFEAGEEVRILSCFHYYHRGCIDQWLYQNRICPVCKYIVLVT
uniref:RING Finger Ubiquitin ligase putative n=1 Tax=Albugo laibachii Nc14 TaxID=890382 RepID=F0WIF7_9STRA|nr:RING Finger Ubiquitin ligase putative [Albugo laibachii Nc14]|eukprot:CCA21039.1 RING Finger Ubiquitin ligase putative [Albugo laibachii Nc14]